MLQTLTRAGRVLELFSSEHPEWGATGVAKELDVSKSQAHELLVSLSDIGLLERDASGRYRLGWRVVALHGLFLETNGIGKAAARALRLLCGRCGETVQLAVWNQGRAICVAACRGWHSVAASSWPVGAELPGHSTGAGKVLLSSRSPDEVRELVARGGLTRMTERTIVTQDQLGAELSLVRHHGFAYEHAEHFADTCGVAAPILNARGEVIAAVGMSVPASRWPRGKKEYTHALVAVTSGLSRAPRRGNRGHRATNGAPATVVALDRHPAAAAEIVRHSRTSVDGHSAS